MNADWGTISGLNRDRKMELSMFRRWRDDDHNRESEGASGLYLISVTVQATNPSAFTGTDSEIMYVDIVCLDSTRGTQTLSFPLRKSDFLDAANQPISGVTEIVLGRIEVRQRGDDDTLTPPEGGITFIRNPDASGETASAAWQDTTLTKFIKILDNDEYNLVKNPDSAVAKLDNIDLRIRYVNGSPEFLLDAVCLTSPRIFALFHEEHPVFSDPTYNLGAWQFTHDNFETRLDAILTDRGKVAGSSGATLV